jgi:uncharacterized membrane protein YccC
MEEARNFASESRLENVVIAARAMGPPLFYGLRLWVSVCLALYVAFWVQLVNAFWAGIAAAVICQPALGTSLRRAGYNVVGTILGGTAGVLLSASFPQQRVGFFLFLALWVAACTFIGTILRNFASYGAGMAGITITIIASNTLGPTGGTNGQAFTIAVTRASEVCIGLICATIVLAATDFGSSARKLTAQLAVLTAEITGQLADAFRLKRLQQAQRREVRRELIGRIAAIDPTIGDAIGESSDLAYHRRWLQAAVEGLFAALSGWRTVANHLEQLPEQEGTRQSEIILGKLPPVLRSKPGERPAAIWTAQPSSLRQLCVTTAQELAVLPTQTPSLRLLADRTVDALLGISDALNGLALLVDDRVPQGLRRRSSGRFHVADWLPAFVNGGRAFLTVGSLILLWVATAWPSGGPSIIFATIAMTMFGTMGDKAFDITITALLGSAVGAALAVAIKFAILPGIETFLGFCLALGIVLIPTGIFISQAAIYLGMTLFFTILVQPENEMNYNLQQTLNTAVAISTGLLAAAIWFRLLPPVSPPTRTRRLLTLTLRELRRLAISRTPRAADWENHIYGRLSVLPEMAEPMQRAQLVAALSVGTEIIRLRRFAERSDLGPALAKAFEALAIGNSALATERLSNVDRDLAAIPDRKEGSLVRLRARSSILSITEALKQYSTYFDAERA